MTFAFRVPLVPLLCGLGLGAPGLAQGQAAPAPTGMAPSPAPGVQAPGDLPPVVGDGDQALGARIAGQGLPRQGVAACASCHGQRGEGQAAAGFPRISGQSAQYLLRQLQSYADGSRTHPVMTPIAKALSEPQWAATAAHYARLGSPGTPPPPRAAQRSAQAGGPSVSPPQEGQDAVAKAAAPDAVRGRRLATHGDERRQLQACANCHGPAGAGQPPVYPYLAGQHASYLQATLGAWRSGERRNDSSGQMPAIAQRLSESDVAAVASYYASLPWVSNAARLARPGSGLPPAVRRSLPGPGAGGPAPQPSGTGTEQGAPLTGGGQGPGGGSATQQPAR